MAGPTERAETEVDVNKPLFLRIDPNLKKRLIHQVTRLNTTQAGIVKMALVKFLEEEEQIEAYKAKRS